MTTFNPVQYQYRTFETTYLFKVKNQEDLTLKILDLAQKCLFKKKFSAKDLDIGSMTQIFTKGDFTTVLEQLVKNHLLPEEHRLTSAKKDKVCKENLQQAIHKIKSKIVTEKK